MSYQVLARKWRPKTFETLVGQEHVVRALSHALEQQRLHHAYLFTGTRGVGKTTLARILAKAINCEVGVNATPCNNCSSCKEINEGRFVDLIEVDAATNTKVDEMRQLLENAVYAPTRGRYKVYVIDEVHMLSNSAFNAMLKTLEEPPEHIKFILATTDPQKIPVTVLSRCLQFNLKKVPLQLIATRLQEILSAEKISYQPTALKLIAKAAAGSMRDALSLLDQAIAHGGGKIEEADVRDMLGVVDQSYLFQLLDALLIKDIDTMLAIADQMEARSLSFDSALQELGVLLHQVTLAQLAPQAIDGEVGEREAIIKFANSFDSDELQLYYQIVLHGRKDLPLAPDEYAGFTMTLFRLLAFKPEEIVLSAESRVLSKNPEKSTSSFEVESSNKSSTLTSSSASSAVNTQHSALRTQNLVNDNWGSLITQLKLNGMAKELAKHCELNELSDSFIELRLNELHKHLLTKLAQEKLQQSLNEHFAKPLKLKIVIGALRSRSPADQEASQKQAQYQKAVAAVEQDGFVRDLIEQFDATLVESSIKPVSDVAKSANDSGVEKPASDKTMEVG